MDNWIDIPAWLVATPPAAPVDSSGSRKRTGVSSQAGLNAVRYRPSASYGTPPRLSGSLLHELATVPAGRV